MNATKLLEKQHTEVKAIFHKLEHGHGPKAPLVEELADNLAAHMGIEQDIFYPAVKGIDPSLVNESFEEHAIAEFALKRLRATAPADEAFRARVVALRELIEHHVKEEEQNLFPEVEKKLGAAKLEAMGDEMETRFEELMEKGSAKILPVGYAATTADQSRA